MLVNFNRHCSQFKDSKQRHLDQGPPSMETMDRTKESAVIENYFELVILQLCRQIEGDNLSPLMLRCDREQKKCLDSEYDNRWLFTPNTRYRPSRDHGVG
ncbi:unnamed protein product [Acidithrix sp. C25]|nr:unnamed protein product [Acidithrix sp. C25]